MVTKSSHSIRELADLLDVGETTLQNQVIPVIKTIMAEALDETFKTFINQKERIEFLEDENRALHRRLEILESKIFSPISNEAPDAKPSTDDAALSLEGMLGIELESVPE